jgi:hypothetical protein
MPTLAVFQLYCHIILSMVFHVKKITILCQKIIFFPIAEGGAKIFGVFHVKNHDFMPKKIIFSPILGGARACAPPAGSPPP